MTSDVNYSIATDPNYAGASPNAIEFHYDAGAAFFKLWLGPSMTYTAVRFDDNLTASEATTPRRLEAAQEAKICFHLDAIGAERGSRVLDVGCGWGTLLNKAVKDYGASEATGPTLSREQQAYIHANSTSGVHVRLESYEHFRPQSPFDGLVSVGAFEHFVKPNLPTDEKFTTYRRFFEICHQCLRPGGRLSLQTIAWGEVDKGLENRIPVQQFFPDSDLPHIDEVVSASQRHFELIQFENRRRDYELTFSAWLTNLRAHKVVALDLVGPGRYDFYERCLQGGLRLFQRRKYYLCRFVFRRLGR